MAAKSTEDFETARPVPPRVSVSLRGGPPRAQPSRPSCQIKAGRSLCKTPSGLRLSACRQALTCGRVRTCVMARAYVYGLHEVAGLSANQLNTSHRVPSHSTDTPQHLLPTHTHTHLWLQGRPSPRPRSLMSLRTWLSSPNLARNKIRAKVVAICERPLAVFTRDL